MGRGRLAVQRVSPARAWRDAHALTRDIDYARLEADPTGGAGCRLRGTTSNATARRTVIGTGPGNPRASGAHDRAGRGGLDGPRRRSDRVADAVPPHQHD